jgi:hypothetical protein
MARRKKLSLWHCYAYGWITLGLFAFSLAGHWLFGWWAYVDEQVQLRQPVQVSDYAVEMTRDMFENWQSEFLQLIWQVGGLAYFLWLGSPQSKEGDDRKEAKLDALIRLVDEDGADKLLAQLDAKYPR